MEDPVYLADEKVLSRMLASESRQQLDSYFDTRIQRDFTEADRRELAVWMRDVCVAEDCQPDILPLSVAIVDRFLSFVRTKRSQLQLLGATALLLASKLRQTRQIQSKHLVYYTQDTITLHELHTWEMFVLTTLRWDLSIITPIDYLDLLIRRVSKQGASVICETTPDEADEKAAFDDEQALCEIEDESIRLMHECCLDVKTSLYSPSSVAWACVARAVELWRAKQPVYSSFEEEISQIVHIQEEAHAHQPALLHTTNVHCASAQTHASHHKRMRTPKSILIQCNKLLTLHTQQVICQTQ